MKNLFLLLLTVFSLNTITGQELFENKQYQFSVEKPTDWILASNDDVLKNLDKYDLSEEKLEAILKTHKNNLLLTSFYKYEIKKHAGLIPTVKINVRSNPTKQFSVFKSMIIESAKGFKTIFPDFEYLEEPKEIEVAGMKCVFFIAKYSMTAQDGTAFKIKSRTYAIPYKNYFFQINCIDGQNLEDASAEFDKLISTIKIGN